MVIMGGYSPIHKRIWKDPDFQELCPEDKLLFIFLCTNESTTVSGIYPLTPKTAYNETGIGLATVTERFNNGFYKNVIYDKDKKLVFVKKLHKYNPGGNPDLIKRAIMNEYAMYPSVLLWGEFFNEYSEFKGLLNGLPTVAQRYNTTTTSNRNSNSNKVRGKGVVKGDRGLAKISAIYEANIGVLTPIVVERLKDIAGEYKVEWFEEAVKEACQNNARKLSYITAILERWKVDGFKVKKTHKQGEKKSDPDKFIKGKYGHMVKR